MVGKFLPDFLLCRRGKLDRSRGAQRKKKKDCLLFSFIFVVVNKILRCLKETYIHILFLSFSVCVLSMTLALTR